MAPIQPTLISSVLNLAFKSSVVPDPFQIRKESLGPNSDNEFFNDPEDYSAEATNACHDEVPEFDENGDIIVHEETKKVKIQEPSRIKWVRDSFSNYGEPVSDTRYFYFLFGLLFVYL